MAPSQDEPVVAQHENLTTQPSAQAQPPAPPQACRTILATRIAAALLDEVKADLATLERPPLLVGFLANEDPAAKMYAEWTQKTCLEHGFRFELRQAHREALEDKIIEANEDDEVGGIIVYYPVFGNRQDQYIQNLVHITKDVEGLSHTYISSMYRNIRTLEPPLVASTQKAILPCTPLAILKVLDYLHVFNPTLAAGNQLYGRRICVINRSEVVGRPLAALLANDGAEVYSVDVSGVQQFTRGEGLRKRMHEVRDLEGMTLEGVLPRCDVVISGVPGEKFKVPVEKVREGAVCVNFSSEKNFTPEIKQKAAIYVPAIGKVTIVILLRNLVRLVHGRQQNGS